MANQKVMNIDKNRNPAEVVIIIINFQLNPPKIIKPTKLIGIDKKGNRYERHK